MITVFYDGKCGLCAREIRHYRKIAPEGIFHWQDVNVDATALRQSGVSLSEGLKLLHAQDHDGRLHIGVEAFILIWQQLARWRMLAVLVSLPIVYQAADWVYRRFADWRFRRLSHCQLAAEQDRSDTSM